MNEDILEGKWEQLKGEVQARWGKITNDRLDMIRGSRKKLLGEIQEAYGIAQKEAEDQLKEWESRRNAA